MAKTKSATLRWKRQPRETGLRSIGAGPYGWDLCWGPNKVASVRVLFKGFSRVTDGWFFVAREDSLGVPLLNSCDVRGRTPQQAREACVAYVLECLRSANSGYIFKAPASCPGTEREQGEG